MIPTDTLLNRATHPPQAMLWLGNTEHYQDLALNFAARVLNTTDATQHPDFLQIGEADDKSISVDTIRALTQFCQIAPTKSARKCVFIPDAGRMTLQASQSLLKTLEEPAVPTCFILLADNIIELIPTIRSRCEMISLPEVEIIATDLLADIEACLVNKQAPTKLMLNAPPKKLLDGFYRVCLKRQHFEGIDACIALKKAWQDSAQLNVAMQLEGLLTS